MRHRDPHVTAALGVIVEARRQARQGHRPDDVQFAAEIAEAVLKADEFDAGGLLSAEPVNGSAVDLKVTKAMVAAVQAHGIDAATAAQIAGDVVEATDKRRWVIVVHDEHLRIMVHGPYASWSTAAGVLAVGLPSFPRGVQARIVPLFNAPRKTAMKK